MKKIKNIDSVAHTWCGQEIAAGATYTIVDLVEQTSWGYNTVFLLDLAGGKAEVYDDTVLFADYSLALSFLRGDVVQRVSSTGVPLIETGIHTGPIGSRTMSLCTPDLSDRTCWYQKGIKVTDETLTDSGDGLTFTSAHPHWIDIYNFKITYTHKQIPTRTGVFGKHADWAVSVKVDTVATTAYTANFAAGTITFNSSQSGKTVTATYWHNDGVTNPSEWLLVPPTGKKFIVEHVELQMSVGISINDTLRFEIWAGSNLATYGSFPDYLFEAGYGQMRADYRGANDFINAANLGQGSVPLMGHWTKEVVVVPFNYIQAFTLDSSVGAIFRLVLLNNLPYSSTEISTGTFYVQML